MMPGWVPVMLAAAALAVAWIAVYRPFGRSSRYVALIVAAYFILWTGVGHVWGYANPWVIGIVAVLAVADLAVLPWWMKYMDRDEDG